MAVLIKEGLEVIPNPLLAPNRIGIQSSSLNSCLGIRISGKKGVKLENPP